MVPAVVGVCWVCCGVFGTCVRKFASASRASNNHKEKTRDKLKAGGGWKVALRSVAVEAEG